MAWALDRMAAARLRADADGIALSTGLLAGSEFDVPCDPEPRFAPRPPTSGERIDLGCLSDQLTGRPKGLVGRVGAGIGRRATRTGARVTHSGRALSGGRKPL